jgi:hypothetical protein
MRTQLVQHSHSLEGSGGVTRGGAHQRLRCGAGRPQPGAPRSQPGTQRQRGAGLLVFSQRLNQRRQRAGMGQHPLVQSVQAGGGRALRLPRTQPRLDQRSKRLRVRCQASPPHEQPNLEHHRLVASTNGRFQQRSEERRRGLLVLCKQLKPGVDPVLEHRLRCRGPGQSNILVGYPLQRGALIGREPALGAQNRMRKPGRSRPLR